MDRINAGVHAAISAWVDVMELPFSCDDRVPAILILYKALRHHLKTLTPEERRRRAADFKVALVEEFPKK